MGQGPPYIEIQGADASAHPNKHIEAVVKHAESIGWRVLAGRGHWGYLYCPFVAREGCKLRVDSTSKNPENYAKGLLREIAKCPHRDDASGQKEEE